MLKSQAQINIENCRKNSDEMFNAIHIMIDKRRWDLDILQVSRILKPINLSKLSIKVGLLPNEEYNVESIINGTILKFKTLVNDRFIQYKPLIVYDESGILIIFSNQGILILDPENQKNTNQEIKKIYSFSSGFIRFINIAEFRNFDRYKISSEAEDYFICNLFNIIINNYRKWILEISSIRLDYINFKQSEKIKFHRITHCWNCKKGLDNNVDVECNTCDWIICPECYSCDPVCTPGKSTIW